MFAAGEIGAVVSVLAELLLDAIVFVALVVLLSLMPFGVILADEAVSLPLLVLSASGLEVLPELAGGVAEVIAWPSAFFKALLLEAIS